nr:RNA-directed DNA polymerase, eukaryota [Tanacetum cinerariifolium]
MANTTPIVTTVMKAANKEKIPKEADVALKVNILDFYEEHYEDILLVIMDKIRRDKRKEVHARLDFEESPKKSRRVKEGSQNSSAGTLPARYRNPSKRPKMQDHLRHINRNMFDRLGHRRQSAFDRLSDTYSPSITNSGPNRANSRDRSHSRGRPRRRVSSPRRDRPRSKDLIRDIEESYAKEVRQRSSGNPQYQAEGWRDHRGFHVTIRPRLDLSSRHSQWQSSISITRLAVAVSSSSSWAARGRVPVFTLVGFELSRSLGPMGRGCQHVVRGCDFPFPFSFISCRSPMGAHYKNSLQSKVDQTVRISKSIFVSNFPEGCTAKDLWNVCNDYGTVVDVFIPNKKFKVGKRFAFVRFIKVINLDRLIGNLNTIWIGRFYLFANPVHFERPKKPNLSPHNNAAAASSYPRGVDQANILVLDDSCVAERDLSNHVMGNVKDVSSISKLRTLIMEEGFLVVNLVYLGGLWVMIECDNVETKANMLQHTEIKSWFHVLQNAVHDFGEALDIEDNVDSSFGCKRLCIKTKLPLSILESFKVIFKGKVYMVRAKELFTWSPVFLGQKEMEYTSNEDYDVGPQKVPDRSQFCEEGPNDDRVSDVEEVSETNFGDNSSIPINHIDELEKQQSEDPFNINRLLRKQPGDESHEVSSSLSHPPGFTPDVSVIRNENGQSAKEIPVVVNAKVMNNFQDVYNEASCDNVDSNVVKKGGSILRVIEDMIRVGKAMGYSMDGCVKDLEQIIGTQRVGDQVSRKRLFWDYVSTCIDRWNGKVVVLGDFNEVRNIDEKRGSCFNPTSARVFDHFISASGLVDVKMEGYTFTWSHTSGSKISKLDRFLVSEGIFSIFPSITAVCLDRHLSDHRPIILCEVQADFGPIPFRFYHFWISLEGFDAMVEQKWRLFSHNDANKMIRFKKKDSGPQGQNSSLD